MCFIAALPGKGWCPLKPKLLIVCLVLWSAFFLVGASYCSDPEPVKNPVRSIEMRELENIVTKDSFSGILVAMASWCPPCREELPVLADLYRQYREAGIDIAAVSVDMDGPSAVQPLINELKIPFPVYWVGKSAVQHYKLVGIPTLIVYQHGRLVEKIPGSQSRKTIEKKIKALLQV